MKTWLAGLLGLACALTFAPRADAKIVALYGTGQGGLQSTGDTGLQGGFEVGAHLTILDGYAEYMAFGSGRSVLRGVVGVRGALGLGPLRFVLRGGVGAIREEGGALTAAPADLMTVPTRTGGVARAGAAIEAGIAPALWLGLGVDGEEFVFTTPSVTSTNSLDHGSDVLGTLKLTFELGI
jgi:hypothetical protein